MSRWDGVFRCEQLGVGKCVVWWEAVSGVGAAAAVFVTALSALAVYSLGRKANAVAYATHEVAHEDRLRESQFLLIYLHPELLEVHSSSNAWLSAAGMLEERFLGWGETQREKALAPLVSLKFPLAEERLSRLHVLEPTTGHSFAKALGSARFIQLAIGPTMRMKNDEIGRQQVKSLIATVREFDREVQAVINAAEKLMYPDS